MAGEVMIIAATLGAIAAAAMTSKVKPVRSRLNTKAIAGAKVDELLTNANVRAFLRVIRHGESGQTDAAYRLINGRPAFSGAWVHPNTRNSAGKQQAAGAYQFMFTTWMQVVEDLKLSDFSKLNQDRAAVGLIAYVGYLHDVIAGNTRAAYAGLSGKVGYKAWTSLPGGPEVKIYGRMRGGDGKVIDAADAADSIFAKWGGHATGK